VFNAALQQHHSGQYIRQQRRTRSEVEPDVPGGDVNGNSIIGNTVGVNSLLDGPGGGIPGSHNSGSTQTTGIMVDARRPRDRHDHSRQHGHRELLRHLSASRSVQLDPCRATTITVTNGGAPVFTRGGPGYRRSGWRAPMAACSAFARLPSKLGRWHYPQPADRG